MRHSLYIILIALGLLSACSSSPVRVPNPITPIEASFKPERLWETRIGSGIGEYYLRLQPAVRGDTFYLTDRKGRLVALDRNSGKRLWKSDLDMPITGGVGIGAARLYVASREGKVVAMSADDGHRLWESLVSTEVLSVPVDAGSHVLVHSTDGKLFALDAATGRVQWTYDRSVPVLNLRGTSTPVVAQGVVFDSFSSGKLAVIQLQTGKVLLEQAMAQPQGRSDLERMIDADAGPLLDGNVVFIATYQGRIVALNLQNGRQLWERKASIYQPMTSDANYLYATNADDAIVAYDKRSGSPVWQNDSLKARDVTAPALAGKYLVVGDFEGYVHILDKQDGKIIARYSDILYELKHNRSEGRTLVSKSRTKLGILVKPLVIDNKVYVYRRNGRLTALALPK